MPPPLPGRTIDVAIPEEVIRGRGFVGPCIPNISQNRVFFRCCFFFGKAQNGFK
eukprot:NODE_5063_length_534_cov_7.226804_g3732_i0.p2 GENE.NODE_5063_length_534_cov_7.226804_g3732_i0~~NODE_5063_length_534_cov_7.226804_g3732_i0.p2  ORF type:complete len:54 (+),score=1.66 NODE_5063_length_534_cov_7.226804_g3732_i0:83-244(+)